MNIYHLCWQQTIPKYFKINKSNEFILTQANPLTPFETMSEMETGVPCRWSYLEILPIPEHSRSFSLSLRNQFLSVLLTSLPDFDELK